VERRLWFGLRRRVPPRVFSHGEYLLLPLTISHDRISREKKKERKEKNKDGQDERGEEERNVENGTLTTSLRLRFSGMAAVQIRTTLVTVVRRL
jgi:hypothetical protein